MINYYSQAIEDKVAWTGADLEQDKSWICQLTEQDLNTLDQALKQLEGKGLKAPFFEKQDFPIGDFQPVIDRIMEELEEGFGFILIRGLDANRYSEEQIAAMDLFDEIMHRPEIKLDMMLEPGDIQFANNYMVLHSRTAFEDYEEQDRRRKLIRLWIKMPNARELAPSFPGRNGFSD